MLTHGIGLVPMKMTTLVFTDTAFQVLAVILVTTIVVALGKMFLPKSRADNVIVILLLVFGLGTVVINTVFGRSLGVATRAFIENVAQDNVWLMLGVVLLLIVIIGLLLKQNQNSKGALVLSALLGLALLLNPTVYDAMENVGDACKALVMKYAEVTGGSAAEK